MVEGMRADCLIVDSTARESPCPTTWAHCLDPGIPLASQPGQPRQLLQSASSQQLPRTPKGIPKVIKIKPRELKIPEKSKKQNLSKTSVFTMFYTHPSIRSCHDFQPRTTEKSIPQPMQQIWYPRVSKMTSKWVPWEPRIDQKSTKFKIWAPRCPVGRPQ